MKTRSITFKGSLLMLLLMLSLGLQAQQGKLDVPQLEKIMGLKASVNKNEAKFTVPRYYRL